MRDNGDEMSENSKRLFSKWDRIVPDEVVQQEIEDMDIADANLIWWLGLGGTICFAMGISFLLVAHILGRPQ